MRRRDFILASWAAIAWPLSGRAQEAGRTYRLGGLSAGSRDAPYFVTMFESLRRLGFVEGQNLAVYWHSFAQHVDRVSDYAAELVKADVRYHFSQRGFGNSCRPAGDAVHPILATSDDMVGSQLVNSLARPEGNTTGISMFSTELDGKRQEILIEAVPALHRMAALANLAQPRRGNFKHCRMQRAHAMSSFQFSGSPDRRRLPQRSTQPRRGVPQR